MSRLTDELSRQEVLDAFAVEAGAGRGTLERYLRAYPQFATELLDLSRMLASQFWDEETPLSQEDEAKIDAAWLSHAAAGPAAVSDPFSSLSVPQLREISTRLGVPRQVITAFRNRRVIMSTVPPRFLERLADLVNTSMEQFVRTLSLPVSPEPAQSYRSEDKPVPSEAVSFEQVLIDAGVPEDERVQLMSGTD